MKEHGIGGRKLTPLGFEALLLFSGIIIFALSFPSFVSDWGFPVLGFIALIPMFALVRMSSWKLIVPYALVYGLGKYVLFNYWLAAFHPGAVFIAPIVSTSQLLFTFPILKAIDRAYPKYGFILQAVAFLAYEYIKTLGFVGYPYGIIGYSLYTMLPLIQISEITGVWGVSLLILLPSAYLGRLLVDWYEGGLPLAKRTWSFQKPFMISYVVYFAFVLVFGLVRMHQVQSWEVARHWKTALVQHNADTWLGGFQQYQRNFRTMSRLSLEALKEAPDVDIIIWSETAFVPGIYWHANYRTDPQMHNLVREFETFAKDLPVPLVTGNSDGRRENPDLPAILPNNTWNRVDYNAVIHYEDGELKESYRKLHLVPFTEHFPYEHVFPRFHALLEANDFRWWEKGTEATVFVTGDGVRFSTPICFEDVFGYLTRDFVNAGAQVIVNLSNDSWSRAVSAQMQHYAMSVYRAIETRRGMVRSTNSGMTVTMDASGRVIDMLDPFIETYLVSTVPIYADPPQTIYLRFGDWMAQGALILTGLSLAAGIFLLIFRRSRQR